MSTAYTVPGAIDPLPVLPGLCELDATSYYGGTIFPNGFIDVSGTSAVVSTLFPKGAHHTTMTMQYMFAPQTIASPDFDPSAAIQFNDLIAEQDSAVCERVHKGVSSRAFDHGILTPKDSLVIEFTQHYLATRGPVLS
jgi:Rieske 2Fe-2S family protein